MTNVREVCCNDWNCEHWNESGDSAEIRAYDWYNIYAKRVGGRRLRM